ncbi:MAG TPA: LD-carboxypeptidase [Chitinophagaceae bacterium]
MDRKSFLQAFVPASFGLLVSRGLGASTPPVSGIAAAPAMLREGDTIGITCPAGAVESLEIRNCMTVLGSWGFNVKCGATVGKKWQRFAGTDAERLADFQSLLDDSSVHAIMFGRGGYGTMRIIDQLNWNKFAANPKWLIGFSDITTVHLHVHAQLGTPTIHAGMSTGFGSKDQAPAAESLRKLLRGEPMAYVVNGHEMNREGNCAGKIVGGNLSIIQACSGSASDVSTDGKILFIEDVNEYKYTIDRMLVHLKRAGKLERLAGLIVGGFTATRTREEESFRQSISELVMEKVSEYSYPVCFDFPAGHVKNNLALKLGVPCQLSVSSTDVILNEVVETITAP